MLWSKIIFRMHILVMCAICKYYLKHDLCIPILQVVQFHNIVPDWRQMNISVLWRVFFFVLFLFNQIYYVFTIYRFTMIFLGYIPYWKKTCLQWMKIHFSFFTQLFLHLIPHIIVNICDQTYVVTWNWLVDTFISLPISIFAVNVWVLLISRSLVSSMCIHRNTEPYSITRYWQSCRGLQRD